MQYVWEYRLWNKPSLQTTDGRTVSIIDPGIINHDAGPDFFNGKIIIDGQEWAGNIEIHYKASDWYRHGHDHDHAYDSVILHVVEISDTEVTRPDGHTIPQIVMACNPNLRDRFYALVPQSDSQQLPCAAYIETLPKVYVVNWIDTLAFERIKSKAERILHIAETSHGDFEQAVYAIVARALGSGINGDSFQALAASAPLSILRKHRGSLLSIESILLGQAGFLDESCDRAYYTALRNEYRFLAAKYGLKRSQGVNWKMSRMRPQAAPHRRLALLAKIVDNVPSLTDSIINVKNYVDARELFSCRLDGYWQDHFNLTSDQQTMVPYMLGEAAVVSLAINAVAPVKFAYGMFTHNHDLIAEGFDMLSQLPRENNRIVNIFCNGGMECPDAHTSQAMIQLRTQYCTQHKCLYCRIGHRWLATQAIRHL